jgi:hypothetical protein
LLMICSAVAMAFWVSCSCTRAAAARASAMSLVAGALAWARGACRGCAARGVRLDFLRVGQASAIRWRRSSAWPARVYRRRNKAAPPRG